MPQSFKPKCDYWWRGSVRPPLGLARLPKKLGYRRVKATISDLIPCWTELLNVSLLLVNSNIDIVVYIYDMYAIA